MYGVLMRQLARLERLILDAQMHGQPINDLVAQRNSVLQALSEC